MSDPVDSPPALDWDDLESIHERVGHMLHSFARLLPPVSDSLDLIAPTRPVARDTKPLPKFSGIPRHRETWLQDMMMAFSTDPENARKTTLEVGGEGLMGQNETHPPFKPQDIQEQQKKEAAEAAAAAQAAQQKYWSRLDEQGYHSAVMMAGGYVNQGPYSRLFPQLQQQTFVQQSHHAASLRRQGRSQSPRSKSNNNTNANGRQGRARSNRNNNRSTSRKNTKDKNTQQQQQHHSPSPAAREPEKPKVVPGAVVAPKKKSNQRVVTKSQSPQQQGSSSQNQEQQQQRNESPSNNNDSNGQQQQRRGRHASPYGRCTSYSKRQNPRAGDIVYLYVEFKRRRLRKIPVPRNFDRDVRVGEYVIVVGDRDYDMGLAVAKEIFEPENPSCRVGEIQKLFDHTDEELAAIRPEREPIIRVATDAECEHVKDFETFENNAKKVCQYYCIAHMIDIEILDSELQFDGRKISFYFDSPNVIDFRHLVKDLHKVFSARIWMENINSPAQKSGQVPQRKKENNSKQRSASRNGRRSAPRGRSNNNQQRSQSRKSADQQQKNGNNTDNNNNKEEQQATAVPKIDENAPSLEELKKEKEQTA